MSDDLCPVIVTFLLDCCKRTPPAFEGEGCMCLGSSLYTSLYGRHVQTPAYSAASARRFAESFMDTVHAIRGPGSSAFVEHDHVKACLADSMADAGGFVVYQSNGVVGRAHVTAASEPPSGQCMATRVETIVWDHSKPLARIMWTPIARAQDDYSCDGHYMTVLAADDEDAIDTLAHERAYRRPTVNTSTWHRTRSAASASCSASVSATSSMGAPSSSSDSQFDVPSMGSYSSPSSPSSAWSQGSRSPSTSTTSSASFMSEHEAEDALLAAALAAADADVAACVAEEAEAAVESAANEAACLAADLDAVAARIRADECNVEFYMYCMGEQSRASSGILRDIARENTVLWA